MWRGAGLSIVGSPTVELIAMVARGLPIVFYGVWNRLTLLAKIITSPVAGFYCLVMATYGVATYIFILLPMTGRLLFLVEAFVSLKTGAADLGDCGLDTILATWVITLTIPHGHISSISWYFSRARYSPPSLI